ncbi:MAG: hotdog fold thioesterase [Saprospiraceae bacterium]|nr:hotdog fold thioesterase [Saprospiraceae bacterium]
MSEMKVDKEIAKQIIAEQIPIHKFLNIEILEIRQGYTKIRVPFREEVIGDIRLRRWHGGIIATIMDSAGGVVGLTYLTSLEDRLSTIDLRVDYLKGAEDRAIIVEGELVRLGSRILVTRMKAWMEDNKEVIIAEGKGVYNFIRMKEKELINK